MQDTTVLSADPVSPERRGERLRDPDHSRSGLPRAACLPSSSGERRPPGERTHPEHPGRDRVPGWHGRDADAQHGRAGRGYFPPPGQGLQQRHHRQLGTTRRGGRPARRHAGAQRRPGPGWLRGGRPAGQRLRRHPERGQPVWPLRVTVTLAVELAILIAFATEWLASGVHRGTARRLALLLLAAAAMGMQSTAVRRLGQMSATYLTSTLTAVLTALATRRLPSDWQRSVGVLITIIIGAALGTLAATQSPSGCPPPSSFPRLLSWPAPSASRGHPSGGSLRDAGLLLNSAGRKSSRGADGGPFGKSVRTPRGRCLVLAPRRCPSPAAWPSAGLALPTQGYGR